MFDLGTGRGSGWDGGVPSNKRDLGEACGFSKWCAAIMLVLLKLLDFYMSGGSKIVVLLTMEDRTGCKYPRVQPGAHIWISYLLSNMYNYG